MATFDVRILPITIENHPDADALELAVVGDYRSIVQKGSLKDGDLVAYIPESAIVPDWLISQLNLEGRLAGKNKNRVKAIKLRGIVSQGLVVKCDYDSSLDFWSIHDEDVDHWIAVVEGVDVTEFLGITKWEPPIPVHMTGTVKDSSGYTIKYDVENIKKFPNVLQEGEEVVITEKLHGTFCCWGVHPECGEIVASKGMGRQGLSFEMNDENEHNLYVKTLTSTESVDFANVAQFAASVYNKQNGTDDGVYLLGEIFGGKVQDLKYGLTEPEFRLFDVYVGTPGQGRYLNFDEMHDLASDVNIKVCPVLYRGPYSNLITTHLTSGKESISGKEVNIREGIVVKPTIERRTLELGRVMLKSVSDAYLLRRGNTTEFS